MQELGGGFMKSESLWRKLWMSFFFQIDFQSIRGFASASTSSIVMFGSSHGSSCSTAVECTPRNRELVGLNPAGCRASYFSSLFSQKCVLKSGQGRCNTTDFPIKNKLSCAAWDKVCTVWAKKYRSSLLDFCLCPGRYHWLSFKILIPEVDSRINTAANRLSKPKPFCQTYYR